MKDVIVSIVAKASSLDQIAIENLVEIPKEKERGDYAFPCFALASRLKKSPNVIAQELARAIKKPKEIERVDAVGPYLNFFVNTKIMAEETIGNILKQKDKYGSSKIEKEKVMIEFSQANTHKAFHVGHIRGTSIGESVARILEFIGKKVVRANYQGDTGMHVAKWIWCYNKFHSKEKIKKDEQWFAKIYVEAVKRLTDKAEYESEVEEINRKLDDGKDKELVKLWKETRKVCLDSLEIIYSQLETKFDNYFFESEVEARGKEVSRDLVKKDIAEVSDGATVINFEKKGFPELGVWVLLRKDGTALYSAKDIALAERKFNEFKIDRALYVVGSEQRQHIMQLFKTLELMKFKQAKNCTYLPVSLVRLPTGKMSSRTGDNVLYSDFRNELIAHATNEIKERSNDLNDKDIQKRAEIIATSAMKYNMLKQDLNKIIIFDKNEALRFEGDTGPYLLYSYARAQSIIRKVGKSKKEDVPELEQSERMLVNELARFPQVVENAAEQYAPNVIAHYAYNLAQTFNEFYHNTQVAGSEHEAFRVQLVSAFAQVLKNALSLLGIPVLEEM